MKVSSALPIKLLALTIFWEFGNLCLFTVSPDRVAARYGDIVILNCTSNCSDLNWKTPVSKILSRGPNWVSLNISNFKEWKAPSLCYTVEKDIPYSSPEVEVVFYSLSAPSIFVKKQIIDKEDVWIGCNVSALVAGDPPRDMNLTLSSEGHILNRTTWTTVSYKLIAGPQHHMMEIQCEAEVGVLGQKFMERAQEQLHVLYGPTQVHITFDHATFVVGGDFKLQCSAEANPPGDYLWKVPNNRSVMFENNNRSLVVYSATEKDSGEYECIVKNYLGINQSHIIVSVTKEKSNKNLWAIIAVPIVIILLGVIFWYAKRKRALEKTEETHPELKS